MEQLQSHTYIRKGFLIYEEMLKYFPIYEEAVSHIRLCDCSNLNSLYRRKFDFLFYQCTYRKKKNSPLWSMNEGVQSQNAKKGGRLCWYAPMPRKAQAALHESHGKDDWAFSRRSYTAFWPRRPKYTKILSIDWSLLKMAYRGGGVHLRSLVSTWVKLSFCRITGSAAKLWK